MRKVLIGTPSHNWMNDIRYTHAFGLTIKACIQIGIDLRWLFPPGNALIVDARNELVAEALAHGFDDLVFIDADQGEWTPEGFLKLLSHPVDCVGAPIRKKTDAGTFFNVKVRGGVNSISTDPSTGLMTAPDMAVGTGLLRLSRKALEGLWNNSEKYRGLSGREQAWIFDARPVKGELVSEDTHVCDKLRGIGIPTYIDPSVTCGHYGLKDYRADFVAWLADLRRGQFKVV